MKLKALSEFLSEDIETGSAVEQIERLRKYSDFLKKPLDLNMFICSPSGCKDEILFEGDWRYSIDDRYTHICWVEDISKKYGIVELHKFKTIGDLVNLGLELKKWE